MFCSYKIIIFNSVTRFTRYPEYIQHNSIRDIKAVAFPIYKNTKLNFEAYYFNSSYNIDLDYYYDAW